MIKPIFCIGGANIDSKLKSSSALTLNTSNPVSSSTTYGGVARNVAENLANWTTNVYLQCVVGNDGHGVQLLDHMRRLGVHTEHCVVLSNKKTSHYYAILNQDGELFVALADMDIYDEVAPIHILPAWEFWNEQSLIFLDTNLPTELIRRALEKAAARKLTVCIDPVSVAKAKKLPDRLDSVFLIKTDRLEASALTNIPIRSLEDCFTAGRILQQRGIEHVVISLGKLGYVLINKTLEEYVPIRQVDGIVDISGAGDAFVAGILLGLQHNEPILQACQLGAAAAAYTTQSLHTVAQDISVSHLHSFINNQKVSHEIMG
nr:carbohydrate kinase family protein [Legionella maioricensis]